MVVSKVSMDMCHHHSVGFAYEPYVLILKDLAMHYPAVCNISFVSAMIKPVPVEELYAFA